MKYSPENVEKVVTAVILVLIVVMLTACSNVPAVTKVNIAVPVNCNVAKPDKPNLAVDSLPIGADIWDKMAALRVDRINQKAYEHELEVAMSACQK